MSDHQALVLRLAGPLQSWGTSSQNNRRATGDRPSKAGVIGLLAAAQGRRRGESLTDLLGLTLGVRVDQPGALLRDFHTVSNLDGSPLRSAAVNGKGVQKRAGDKRTHVTYREYLQDAVFAVVLGGPTPLLNALGEALRQPRFPLALGRRSCPPAQPLLVSNGEALLWPGAVSEVLLTLPWQASEWARRKPGLGAVVHLAYTVDDVAGDDLAADVPSTFAHDQRRYSTRQVRHGWVSVPTDQATSEGPDQHDPFSLLGW